MYFPLIIPAILFIICIIAAIIEQEYIEILLGFLVTPFLSLILILSSVLIGSCINANEIIKTEETEIIALEDSSEAHGACFLGSGSVKEDLYYYYITKDENDGKQIKKINVNNVKIYDNEKETPHITKITKQNSSWFVNFFFITEKDYYEFHIPPHSIKHNFNIDLN